MRPIDEARRRKFLSHNQTKAANADPAAVVWITRPTVPLTDAEFLDRATVTEASGLTACDVAVRRLRAGREADRVYLAYIDENGAHVKSAATAVKLSDYVWTDEPFAAAATDVAICFDGTMPKAADGTAQFVTAQRPWVFWVSDGVLTGRVLGLLGDTVLASANAEKVSAVRATWAEATGVDFGLVVFFTLNGSLYYRQLIGGAWTDAEPVTFGPEGVTWTDIAAFRTWDYRIGVQAVGSDGKVYELFTQFQGIGKHAAEHISLSAAAAGKLISVTHHTAQETEHIALTLAAGAPYGGLYELGTPTITTAYNLPDSEDDWGHIAVFVFDRHLRADEVAAQSASFVIVDSRGRSFAATSATLGPDGMTVTLTFLDFNGARGECAATYTPGTVHTMADVAMTETSLAFTPQNLHAPSVPAPEVESITNAGYEAYSDAIIQDVVTGTKYVLHLRAGRAFAKPVGDSVALTSPVIADAVTQAHYALRMSDGVLQLVPTADDTTQALAVDLATSQLYAMAAEDGRLIFEEEE